MKHVVRLFIWGITMLILAACGDSKSVRQLPHLGDTPYLQDRQRPMPAFPLFRQAPIAILTNGAIKKRIIVFSPKI